MQRFEKNKKWKQLSIHALMSSTAKPIIKLTMIVDIKIKNKINSK